MAVGLPLWRQRVSAPLSRQNGPLGRYSEPSRRLLGGSSRVNAVAEHRPQEQQEAGGLEEEWQRIQDNRQLAELSCLFLVKKSEGHVCKLCSATFRSAVEGWVHVAHQHLKNRI